MQTGGLLDRGRDGWIRDEMSIERRRRWTTGGGCPGVQC